MSEKNKFILQSADLTAFLPTICGVCGLNKQFLTLATPGDYDSVQFTICLLNEVLKLNSFFLMCVECNARVFLCITDLKFMNRSRSHSKFQCHKRCFLCGSDESLNNFNIQFNVPRKIALSRISQYYGFRTNVLDNICSSCQGLFINLEKLYLIIGNNPRYPGDAVAAKEMETFRPIKKFNSFNELGRDRSNNRLYDSSDTCKAEEELRLPNITETKSKNCVEKSSESICNAIQSVEDNSLKIKDALPTSNGNETMPYYSLQDSRYEPSISPSRKWLSKSDTDLHFEPKCIENKNIKFIRSDFIIKLLYNLQRSNHNIETLPQISTQTKAAKGPSKPNLFMYFPKNIKKTQTICGSSKGKKVTDRKNLRLLWNRNKFNFEHLKPAIPATTETFFSFNENEDVSCLTKTRRNDVDNTSYLKKNNSLKKCASKNPNQVSSSGATSSKNFSSKMKALAKIYNVDLNKLRSKGAVPSGMRSSNK